FRYELIRNGRRKGFLAATFGIPLIVAVFMLGFHIYQLSKSPDEANPLAALALEQLKHAGYVDESGLFAEVPSRLESLHRLYPDEATALQALEAKEIDVYFYIPADYIQTGTVVLHMRNLQLFLMDDGTKTAQQLIYSTFASGLNEAHLLRLSSPAEFSEYTVTLN